MILYKKKKRSVKKRNKIDMRTLFRISHYINGSVYCVVAIVEVTPDYLHDLIHQIHISISTDPYNNIYVDIFA